MRSNITKSPQGVAVRLARLCASNGVIHLRGACGYLGIDTCSLLHMSEEEVYTGLLSPPGVVVAAIKWITIKWTTGGFIFASSRENVCEQVSER